MKPSKTAKSRKHCKRGHPVNATNTYIRKDGYPECKQCTKDRVKAYRFKKRLRRALREKVKRIKQSSY